MSRATPTSIASRTPCSTTGRLFTLDHRAKACAHVRESDFPETGRWMLEHVQAAGFRLASTILDDDFFKGWAFTKT